MARRGCLAAGLAARRLSDDQLRELATIVETGPDVQTDGVVRWRRVDLQAVIKERFGVKYGARWVSQILHDLGFSHMSARPQHPKQDGSRRLKKLRQHTCRPLERHCGHQNHRDLVAG